MFDYAGAVLILVTGMAIFGAVIGALATVIVRAMDRRRK